MPCVWGCVCSPGLFVAGSSVFLSPQALSAAAAMPAAKQTAMALPVNFMMFMFTPVSELLFYCMMFIVPGFCFRVPRDGSVRGPFLQKRIYTISTDSRVFKPET